MPLTAKADDPDTRTALDQKGWAGDDARGNLAAIRCFGRNGGPFVIQSRRQTLRLDDAGTWPVPGEPLSSTLQANCLKGKCNEQNSHDQSGRRTGDT